MFLFHRHMQASRRRTYAPGTTLTSGRVAMCPRAWTTCASSRRTSTSSSSTRHGCQMAIVGFLDRMCLALRASGLWHRFAALQNLIPSFPWIASHALHPGTIQGKEGIKFCHLAKLNLKIQWRQNSNLAELSGGQSGGRVPRRRQPPRRDGRQGH